MNVLTKLFAFLKLLFGAVDASPSTAFLLEENKKLKSKVNSLQLENKILRGYDEIEKKISGMSDDDFDSYAKRKISD